MTDEKMRPQGRNQDRGYILMMPAVAGLPPTNQSKEEPCMLSKPDGSRRGFSLLELSIVLTIIALLIGGVLTGQTLIQQARINKIMTDIQKYLVAVNAFQNKYGALPGDMSNATKYWGQAGSPTNTWAGCYSIVGTGTQTCDGDGNGYISSTSTVYAEQYRAWQQLSLAGFIEGSYSGVNAYSGGTSFGDLPGVNIPKGPMNNTGYGIYYLGNYTSTASPFVSYPPINFGHVIFFGATSGSTALIQYAALTTPDMLSIDTKYDDGLPFSGVISVISPNTGYDPGCVTSPYTIVSTYNYATQGVACSFIYATGF